MDNNIIDENDCNRSLNEEGFISAMKLSPKKIQFYKKYNKHIYLSLMVLSIIAGILIVLSEFTLVLPVNISLFVLIFKNIENEIYIHIFCILSSSLFFAYTTLSFERIKIMGINNLIFGHQNTNTHGLLNFCHSLSMITFPLSLNIIKMIFHENADDDIYTTLEEDYGEHINNSVFYKVVYYIPSFLIVIIIIYYFEIYKRICKKKKKTSFYIKNKLRDKYIEEGREYLIRLHKRNLNNLEFFI